MGLFSKGKTRTILKFHRTDLLFAVILQRGETCLKAKYSRFSLSRSRKDPVKHFEISVF